MQQPLQGFELALATLIDIYRNKFPRQQVIEALNAQAGLLVGDDGWTRDTAAPEEEEEEAPKSGEAETQSEPTEPTAA